jgi:hypothetical protein
MKILSIFSNSYTPIDAKTEATRLLGALSKILVLNVSKKEKLVTYKRPLTSTFV